MQVFHASVSWWLLAGVWETVSLLKSPGLFSVFWQIPASLLFGLSLLTLLLSKYFSPCINPLETVTSAPITIGITATIMFHSYLSFRFFSVLPRGQPEQKSPLFSRFSFFLSFFFFFFFFWQSLCLVLTSKLGNPFVSQNPKEFCVSFSRTDSRLCIYHLFAWSNLNFLHNSQWATLPTQSCLLLYSLCANLLHSLTMWFVFLSLSPHNLHLLFCCDLSIFVFGHSHYSVVLCGFQKRFSFSHKVSLSLPCLSFLVWDFACLLLVMSIELFFFPFLIPGYFCSVDACVVCIVSGRCNQSSSAFFI